MIKVWILFIPFFIFGCTNQTNFSNSNDSIPIDSINEDQGLPDTTTLKEQAKAIAEIKFSISEKQFDKRKKVLLIKLSFQNMNSTKTGL